MYHPSVMRVSILALIALSLFFPASQLVNADTITFPERKKEITELYTEYDWWLLTWAENELVCKIVVEHEGTPNFDDIFLICGLDVLSTWLDHPLCDAASDGGDTSQCLGYYLHYVGSRSAEREIEIDLPPPLVNIQLKGCVPSTEKNSCAQIPTLRFNAVEPLQDESITKTHVRVDNKEWIVLRDNYDFPLFETSLDGQLVTFWAESSFGDASSVYETLVRVIPFEDGEAWQVDVLSTQWTGNEPALMALDWWVLPAIETPHWLSTPEETSELATEDAYHYLAGQLIKANLADASACWDGGLVTVSYASQCGIESAWEEMLRWQNRFDGMIYEVSNDTGLSAYLLKNLIAQESQFWPGQYELSPQEFGLGRLTDEGADAIFLWNADFFADFCPELFLDSYCVNGYNQMAPGLQAILRGALAIRMDATCVQCPYGFDEKKLEHNIEIIVESLSANAFQVGQIITNITNLKPGDLSSYEDLWRFTLVNYNAGPGCLSEAVKEAYVNRQSLDWGSVSSHLVGDCKNAVDYVENVTAG